MDTKDGPLLANKGIDGFEGETFGAIASSCDLGGGTKVWTAVLVHLSFRVLVLPN